MHEHYDANGDFTGTTVLTRESEWNDETRELALALTYLEDKTCSGCGNDLEKSLEPSHSWDVDDKTVCHACAALATVQRDVSEAHKDEKPHRGRPMHMDGRIFTVRLYSEDGA